MRLAIERSIWGVKKRRERSEEARGTKGLNRFLGRQAKGSVISLRGRMTKRGCLGAGKW